MNKIWSWIMLISIFVGILNGNVEKMTTGLFDSAKSAIETCMNIFRNNLLMEWTYENS